MNINLSYFACLFLLAFGAANFVSLNDELIDRSLNLRDDLSNVMDVGSDVQQEILQGQTQYLRYTLNASDFTGQNNTGSYAHLYISGNIALWPASYNFSESDALDICVGLLDILQSNVKPLNCSGFLLGLYGILVPVNVTSQKDIYLSVSAPKSANVSDLWLYLLNLSPDQLAYSWNGNSYLDLLDADDNSALLVTGPLMGRPLNSSSQTFSNLSAGFQIYLYPADYNGLEGMILSYTAITNGPAIYASSNQTLEMTNRGGGLHQQFYIGGLNASTSYVVYLTSWNEDLEVKQVYLGFEFRTMDSAACRIIYNLDFCDQVAYAVPVSSRKEYNSTEALKELYDKEVEHLYANFSKALQQVPCNASNGTAYSPLVTCTDCVNLYKAWLCAVTIPRCSTFDIGYYTDRPVNESRNEFVNEVVQPPLPYNEILPCIELCQDMVRTCPAQLKLSCPVKQDFVMQSYGVFSNSLANDTCNLISNQYFKLTWKAWNT
ncbi:hypothetical protein PUMCH_002349 [Australozyma saopauloensis]|uniref:Stretch-activated cation channel MID1 n=1 Tax=Australozyma saopauloensis TaxID=291208 RepID=A0AAX4H971_9ASCO|nr:hypothetical protein PUMCH_002349 [[Candida] saopauloensis]